jgi:hypothetical protein
MSREVIQDFLNLAGVVGIALTNRRMRPYFYGLDSILDRTKQALGQGVLQVVENIPEGFESFEFHFVGHTVFIYKLTHGLVLLVLTDRELDLKIYRHGITKIKYLIETDTYNTVAYFKLLLGSVTQHSMPSNNWNTPNATANNIEPKPAASQPPQPTTVTASANNANVTATNTSSRNTVSNKASAATTVTPTSSSQSRNPTSTQVSNQNDNQTGSQKAVSRDNRSDRDNNIATATNPNKQVSSKTVANEYKLDELLTALNKLSIFTTQYLGKVVVTNYWKSTRPDSPWLSEFEIDRSGNISHPKQSAITCTTDQHSQMKLWVSAYIKRCKQVIRNFDQMLNQDCLDERQKSLLL